MSREISEIHVSIAVVICHLVHFTSSSLVPRLSIVEKARGLSNLREKFPETIWISNTNEDKGRNKDQTTRILCVRITLRGCWFGTHYRSKALNSKCFSFRRGPFQVRNLNVVSLPPPSIRTTFDRVRERAMVVCQITLETVNVHFLSRNRTRPQCRRFLFFCFCAVSCTDEGVIEISIFLNGRVRYVCH